MCRTWVWLRTWVRRLRRAWMTIFAWCHGRSTDWVHGQLQDLALHVGGFAGRCAPGCQQQVQRSHMDLGGLAVAIILAWGHVEMLRHG